MKYLKHALATLLGFVLVYLFGSFINATWNPMDLSPTDRLGYVLFGLAFVFVLNLLTAHIEGEL